MTRRSSERHYTLRSVQSLLGLSRGVVTGLIEAGFVSPSRGSRNEFLFTFQDVVLLRTAHQLQEAKIPARKIVRSLASLRTKLPQQLPLTGLRISAVGQKVAVRMGPDQWEAESGQLLLDFEVAHVRGAVTFLDSEPESAGTSHRQAEEWLTLAEQLAETDARGSEHAYRKGLELQPEPHYGAYTNLGVLLVEGGRYAEALAVFDKALEHFPADSLLHFNRAVVLEELAREEEAASSYSKCLELEPDYADAHYNLARLSELRGDKQAALRHYSAYRRLSP